MANQVFANGRELACKAGAGKVICATPDVCMTPPENPATPPGVPVPYPNTAMASDTSDGSTTVQISGQEIMLKNKSSFKKSSGDEAGCAAKKGVVSSKNTGKVYFIDWSMDVKFEGENVVRHLDKTTNNHGSPPNEAIPWPFVDSMSDATLKAACDDDKKQEEAACKGYKKKPDGPGKDVCEEAGVGSSFTRAKGATTTRSKKVSENTCAAARRCRLVPYDPRPGDGMSGCCPAQTGDHLVPKASFFEGAYKASAKMAGWESYKMGSAPCMCTEGGSCSGTHGLRHAHHKTKAPAGVKHGDTRSFADEVSHCADGAKEVAPQCSKACIEAQLKEGHKQFCDPPKDIKHKATGKTDISVYDKIKAVIAETLKKFPKKAR